jgi:lipopolysaccharide heptosyltransferase II
MNAVALLADGDRVLVTRLNYLGDVVLSLPLVDAIRARYPGVEVDYLARSPGADLLALDPRFSRVFAVAPGPRATASLVRAVRERRYRAVVDLYSNPRSAWLAWATGAPMRVGGDRRGRRLLYTHRIVVPKSVRRVTDVFLRYGAPLGVSAGDAVPPPSLSVTPAESRAAERVLRGAGAPERGRVGVHPGGKWPVKRWPTQHFVDLIRTIRRRIGVDVVVFTGPDEADATERVREQCRDQATFLPVLPIRSLAAVVSRLDAMVACDGGVMHVAAAVGTPTVGIFGSSEPDVWFPYGTGHAAAYIDVDCRPCHRHVCPLGHTRCLNDLSAGAVVQKLAAVMGRDASEDSR